MKKNPVISKNLVIQSCMPTVARFSRSVITKIKETIKNMSAKPAICLRSVNKVSMVILVFKYSVYTFNNDTRLSIL